MFWVGWHWVQKAWSESRKGPIKSDIWIRNWCSSTFVEFWPDFWMARPECAAGPQYKSFATEWNFSVAVVHSAKFFLPTICPPKPTIPKLTQKLIIKYGMLRSNLPPPHPVQRKWMHNTKKKDLTNIVKIWRIFRSKRNWCYSKSSGNSFWNGTARLGGRRTQPPQWQRSRTAPKYEQFQI